MKIYIYIYILMTTKWLLQLSLYENIYILMTTKGNIYITLDTTIKYNIDDNYINRH